VTSLRPRAAAAGLALLALIGAAPAAAHEVRPAYLEIVQQGAETYDVLFKVPAAGGGLRFGLYLTLPEDAEVVGAKRSGFSGRAHVERFQVRRAGGLAGARLRVDGLSQTRTDVLVRVARADGAAQVLRLTPDVPAFTVEAAPGAGAVVRTYLALGVEHILLGLDHLLFVLGLLILVGGGGRLFWTISAFTLAHSLTLAAATLGFVAVAPQPVEAIIALSIVFVAVEILHARRGSPGLSARMPWLMAFAFGLLHGVGFAGALGEIGLPHGQIPLALLAFNAGVEVGQLLFVGALFALGPLLRRLAVSPPAGWPAAAAYGIGGAASFWLLDRVLAF